MTTNKRKIERISQDVAEKITTAQVVVSLSSALRQLVDNSIDAGARIIDIRAKNNGFDSMEVQDNGSGIEEKNFDALCKPHSTSKLTDYSDFDKLSTLGFRGEALNALCALSTVTIFTRAADSELGTRMKYDHSGNIVDKKSAAREIGTTILVENLFETLPVRRKELERTSKRDFVKLLATVQSFSLMCPHIKFLCTNFTAGKKQNIICTPGGNSSVRDVVANLFGNSGKIEKSPLVEIKQSKPTEEIILLHSIPKGEDHIFDLIKIEGFLSSCEHGNGRSTSDRQFVYINNRPVEYSRVCSVVNDVYKQYNKSQYPILVIFITVPGDKIDVNITPDKKTVMFEKEKHLLAIVRSSILSTFQPILGSHSTIRSSVEDRRNFSFYSSQSSSANSTLDETNLDDSSILNPNESLPNIEDLLKQRKFPGKTSTPNQPPKAKKPCLSSQDSSSSSSRRTKIIQIPSTSNTTLDSFSFKFTPYERPEPKEEENTVNAENGMEREQDIIPIRRIEPPLLRNLSRGFDTSSVKDDSMLDRVEKEIMDNEEKDLEDIASQELEIIGERKGEDSQSIYVRPQQKVSFSMEKLRERFEKLKAQSSQESEDQQNVDEFTTPIDPEHNEEAERQLSRAIKKDDFLNMKVIGQFNKGFIICILRSHLFIVDQHASDEKYNFERLQNSAKLTKQPLFSRTPLNFGAVQEMIIRENLHIFRANGFDFEFKEHDGCVKAFMTARPEILSQHLTNNDLDEIIAMVSQYPNQMYRPTKIRKIFASRACRKSIMIGKFLNEREMAKVVRNLATLEQPWNCPHGRPTIRHLASV